MKKFKKAIMGVTALVMAFSMTALAACSNGKDPKDPSDPGNPNNPSNPNNPNEGTLVSPAKSDTVKVLEALQTQSFKAATLEYTLDTTKMVTYYDSDSEGKILTGATKTTGGSHDVTNGKVKVNVKDLSLDASSHYYEEALDKDGKKVADSEVDSYAYTFGRGGHLFNAVDENDKEITDFSEVTLTYGGNLGLPPQVSAIFGALPEAGAPASALTPLNALLNLAETYGGATFADKELKVNLNKVAYGLYSEVLEVVEGLNENTTVSDVIAAKPVKALIESLTYGMDAKDIMDQVAAMAGGAAGASTLEGESEGGAGMAMVGAIVTALPAAAEGESVYDYLVKVLNSTAFADAVLAAMGMQSPVSTSLGALKVSYVIEIVMGMMGGSKDDQGPSTGASPLAAEAGEDEGLSFADIKAMIKGYLDMVTVTEDKVTVTTEAATTELSALELVFAVGDDYTVSSVTYGATISEKLSYVDKYTHNDESSYVNNEVDCAYGLTASIDFAKEEYTLTDINDNAVEIRTMEYTAATNYERIVSVNPGSQNKYDIEVGVTFSGSAITEIAAYTNVNGQRTKIESSNYGGNSAVGKLTFTDDAIDGIVVVGIEINEKYAYYGDTDASGYVRVTISVDSEEFTADNDGYFNNQSNIYFDKTSSTSQSTVKAIIGEE